MAAGIILATCCAAIFEVALFKGPTHLVKGFWGLLSPNLTWSFTQAHLKMSFFLVSHATFVERHFQEVPSWVEQKDCKGSLP